MNMEKQHKTKPGAIFHFDCKVHGRSTGANAIRLAAYRSGSPIALRTHRPDPQLHEEERGLVVGNPGATSCASMGKRSRYAVERRRSDRAPLRRSAGKGGGSLSSPCAEPASSLPTSPRMGQRGVRRRRHDRGRLLPRKARQSTCPHPADPYETSDQKNSGPRIVPGTTSSS